MILLNVCNIICDWLENKIELPFSITTDIIQDASGDAACIRHDPAPAAERRYNDGTRLLKWSLSIYVRAANRANARHWAEAMAQLLDGEELIDPESNIKISTEAATLPQYISTDAKNFTLYMVTINATYLEPKTEA